MPYSSDDLKNISAILKFVYQNPNVHRNVLRKNMLKQKISSKEKFNSALNLLLSLGYVDIDKENLAINKDVINVSMIQKSKSNGDYELVVPNSNKTFVIEKSVGSGFKMGDFLDYVELPKIDRGGVDDHKNIAVLGKSVKSFDRLNKHNKQEMTPEDVLLGRVVKLSHDSLVFIPNNKNLPTRQISLTNNLEECSKFQDKICWLKLECPEAPYLGGKIVKICGDAGNPIHEYDAIAESYGAIMNWENEKDEIAKIPSAVDTNKLNLISEEQALKFGQKGKVVDLRHLMFTTVDPATCKDMDDAIYSTIDKDGNYVVYTAVANVTKYVEFDSKIGQKYINGGFTIYAPNKAYNILPTELSTGICSLNPNQDRLAFVVKTVLDKNGEVKESHIFDAIINSKHKYSYEQAQEIVDNLSTDQAREELAEAIAENKPLSLDQQTILNYYAGEVIKKGFENRKMIRFVSNKERDVIFDEDLDDVVDIKPVKHLAYHEVIEAFMITANEATAKYAKDHNFPNIYRVHEKPNERKTEKAGEFFKILGIEFDGDFSAQGTRALIEKIHNTSSEEVVNDFLIKTQSRAKYSSDLNVKNQNDELWLGEQISHYALQSKHYSHTTSPIRRVPDYITQFNILANIHGEKQINLEKIKQIVKIVNDQQLAVDQAEKDFADISSVLYCEKHIGEKMSGKVTKIRYTSPEEGYEDEIVVIVKDDTRGISVEIPLSNILGRKATNCSLSEHFCAVYDEVGNTVLTLCKPIDFIIERADRKLMNIVGRTTKQMVDCAQRRFNNRENYHQKTFGHIKDKEKARKRWDKNRQHKNFDDEAEWQ